MRYRSKFEQRIASQIPTAAYETLKIPFTQPSKSRTYTPDFVLTNGVVLEVKGLLSADDRAKMIWVKQQHPELDIRFVFQRASNPINKESKTTYAAWAEANGFLWCEGTVPKGWVQ